MGAGSTFTLNAPSLAGALSPPERVRPARQNDRQMRALRFGIVFFAVFFLETTLLAAARVPSVVFRFAVMAVLLGSLGSPGGKNSDSNRQRPFGFGELFCHQRIQLSWRCLASFAGGGRYRKFAGGGLRCCHAQNFSFQRNGAALGVVAGAFH